ncbi:MAG: Ig-like domain-containing protein [Terracidiphilus sp.]
MRFRMAGLAVSAALAISGCGGGSSGTTTLPPVAPTVTSVTPGNGTAGAAINTTVTAVFSLAMNAATITSSTFTLTPQGGAAVAGTYSVSGTSVTLTPSANLAYGTTYTATITTGAQDASGTALASNFSWSFTTAAAPVPPAVTANTPANLAMNVSVSAPGITATFSQAMNASTLTTSTFTLTGPGNTAVNGTVTYTSTGSVATFTPSANLAYSTMYTATITTGAQDSAGTALASNVSWSFTTGAAPAPPTVIAVTPANGASGVSVSAPGISATFSQAMNTSTLSMSTFTLTPQGGTAVTGTVAYTLAGSVATFTPAANLDYNTLYTATITTGAQNSMGTALAANDSWSFTTALPPAPMVVATEPGSGAMNVSVSNDLTATFSLPMNVFTITSSTFTLAVTGGAAVTGTVSYSVANAFATFAPSAALAYNTNYTATITIGATSSAGAPLAANYAWTFTTETNPNQVTVDYGTADQIIRGFGGSTAWLGQLTTAQADALFSPTSGLGLSILRVRIDPTGSASTNSWATSNWGQEVANAKEAVAANPNAIVFASPWTAPASMKTSDTSQPYYSGTCSPAAGYCGGYLDPANYAAYSTYLEDFVTYFNTNAGFDLYAISMQNEPDYSAESGENYESCSWTAAQMDTWIAGNASTLTAKLIMPESFNFNPAQALTALDDPSAESLISIVAGHLYGVTPAPYPLAGQDDKDLWMTEHALMPAGAQPTITDALAAAEEVHNSMVTGSYNAYVWWWIWDDPNDGVNYGLIDNSTTSPAPTYYGYAIGQFSQFIQPGYHRYQATANPSAGVYVSAYAGTENAQQHYVIVAINSTASPVSQAFAIDNATVTSMTPWQTASGGGLAQQTAVSLSGGAFTYTLPAQSITTFVQ